MNEIFIEININLTFISSNFKSREIFAFWNTGGHIDPTVNTGLTEKKLHANINNRHNFVGSAALPAVSERAVTIESRGHRFESFFSLCVFSVFHHYVELQSPVYFVCAASDVGSLEASRATPASVTNTSQVRNPLRRPRGRPQLPKKNTNKLPSWNSYLSSSTNNESPIILPWSYNHFPVLRHLANSAYSFPLQLLI